MVLVAVFGASGNVGHHVVEELLSLISSEGKAEWKVRAVSRTPEALLARFAGDPGESALEAVRADLSDPNGDDVRAALQGAERVFLCLPQSFSSEEMVAAGAAFAPLARSQRVRHVVRLSSFGIDDRGASAASLAAGVGQGPLGAAHIAGEQAILDAGLTLTSVRPTSFFTNFLAYDLPSVRAEGVFRSPLGLGTGVNWVDCRDIGAVAARALLDPSLDGRVLDVTGPPSSTLRASQMAALLSAKAGREVVYQEIPAPEPPESDFGSLWRFLRQGGFQASLETVKEVTGRCPTDFAEWLDTLDLSPTK